MLINENKYAIKFRKTIRPGLNQFVIVITDGLYWDDVENIAQQVFNGQTGWVIKSFGEKIKIIEVEE